MKIRNIAILVLALSALASCSFDKKRIDYKVASSSVPSLEVPPDLTSPAANEQYAIPGADGALAANYSDYSKGVSAQPAKGAVLPELKNVRLERKDAQRWLVVSDKAENVWPAVKAFWFEMGFHIQVDNPQAGVMETDWQENRSNVPQHFMRGVLGNGKVLDTLKPAGQRDQYVTRLERSKDGGTEIYLSRQVMEEVQVPGQKTSKWLPRANDPEIEIAVLQMLMSRLGGEASTEVSNATLPASSDAAAAPANVQLKEVAGGKVITINEPFDKSWRKVGLALDKGRIAVEDKDRINGVYLLRATVAAKGKKTGGYQVTVRASGATCEVSVRNAEGESDKESLRIAEALYQNIEK
ncbi:MAG: hypothetical protein FD173_1895 [Gallionellaceae bacterium]|nr:MAG: hypothetical protein FD173_1895 [Gallionellaceae bacterium]